MPDALTQVEDLLAACLRDYAPLNDKTVYTDLSEDIAPDDAGDVIRIFSVAVQFEIPPEQWTTRWLATFEFEVTNTTQTVGTIGRANRTALAHIIAALAQDRTLGGMVGDIQEIDLASVMANGKDLGAASLQARVEFHTSREDPFTLLTS